MTVNDEERAALATHSIWSFDDGAALDGRAVETPGGAKLVARYTGDGIDFVWLAFRVDRKFWQRAPSAAELMQARRALLRPIYEKRRAWARTEPLFAAHLVGHTAHDEDWLPAEFRADIPIIPEGECPTCLERRYAWMRSTPREDLAALASVAHHLPDGPLRRALSRETP